MTNSPYYLVVKIQDAPRGGAAGGLFWAHLKKMATLMCPDGMTLAFPDYKYVWDMACPEHDVLVVFKEKPPEPPAAPAPAVSP